ncbi:unnamed protein product [Rhizoctonia solani]|uniref:Nephrocystin 3-like N-terminal domain-containing protein n=1 Tax=Rhizoctonia solani TaxID=456999 RepID=A0A8H3GXU4_9AGAM|nr:unnamed protein product [Rhizoctonia solani]
MDAVDVDGQALDSNIAAPVDSGARTAKLQTTEQPPPVVADTPSIKWKGVKEFARVLEPLTNLFGPVKEMTNLLVECVEKYELAEESKGEYDALHIRLDGIFEILNDSRSDRMSSRIEHLPSSLSAWYNSAEGIELKRRECTPGTRVNVLANLLDWARSGGGGVYWLNGMAGTGKTTIAYSVCADLDARQQLGGSFFCSRLREECRDVNLIIPSIAYQLARFSRPFQYALSKVLEKDPDVHGRQPHMQFDALIAKPILEVQHTLPEELIVVIDALDECDQKESTERMLDVLLSKSTNLPIMFIVSSRPEPQIRDQMTHERVKSRLVLHELDKGEVQADIDRYLREGLAQMNPSEAEITSLVERAGILFIYAATATGSDNRSEHGD